MSYQPPLKDFQYIFSHITPVNACFMKSESIENIPDMITDILQESGRLAMEMLAPIQASGDKQGVILKENQVIMPDGWKKSYKAFADAGWIGMKAATTNGGMGLPTLLSTAVFEMISGANMAFGLCPLLTQGAINALEQWGTDQQKFLYLSKLISGEWAGTMNLTEPQAGSDVGALTTKAVKNADGTYNITGSKIFITYGDHDLCENIVHLVLARTGTQEDGTKGLSLFLVPKILVNDDGSLGEKNGVQVTGLEHHKLGIHASPTCMMKFGESVPAIGYLVGEEHKGMKCMFTMMNDARLNVATQGAGLMEQAFQMAHHYAGERKQGKYIGNPDQALSSSSDPVPIIEHHDVQRMLLTIKAFTQASRAVVLETAYHLDMARHAEDQAQRQEADLIAGFLTPIAKGWVSEKSVEMTSLALQVFGGMGYIEETGIARLYRDSRITTIYEGTTGIQAIDLVMRKLPLNDGFVFRYLADRIAETSETCLEFLMDDTFSVIGDYLDCAKDDFLQASEWMMQKASYLNQPEEALAGATPYLHLCGLVLGGYYLTKGALNAQKILDSGVEDDFLKGQVGLAKFYAENFLPSAKGLSITCTRGVQTLKPVRFLG